MSSYVVLGSWRLILPNRRENMKQNDENCPFADFEVVDTHTTRDALEDGVRIDLHAVGRIPVYAPVYVYIRYATRSPSLQMVHGR